MVNCRGWCEPAGAGKEKCCFDLQGNPLQMYTPHVTSNSRHSYNKAIGVHGEGGPGLLLQDGACALLCSAFFQPEKCIFQFCTLCTGSKSTLHELRHFRIEETDDTTDLDLWLIPMTRAQCCPFTLGAKVNSKARFTVFTNLPCGRSYSILESAAQDGA